MSSTERAETESVAIAALPSMAEFQVFVYSLLLLVPFSDSVAQAQELEMTELRSELLCSKKVRIEPLNLQLRRTAKQIKLPE